MSALHSDQLLQPGCQHAEKTTLNILLILEYAWFKTVDKSEATPAFSAQTLMGYSNKRWVGVYSRISRTLPCDFSYSIHDRTKTSIPN